MVGTYRSSVASTVDAAGRPTDRPTGLHVVDVEGGSRSCRSRERGVGDAGCAEVVAGPTPGGTGERAVCATHPVDRVDAGSDDEEREAGHGQCDSTLDDEAGARSP